MTTFVGSITEAYELFVLWFVLCDSSFALFQIYAPSKHNDYGSKSFPGIDDAIEKAKTLNTADSWQSVQHEIWRVSRVVTQASLCLIGEFTWMFS